MSGISKEQVERVAKLAQIRLDEAQIGKMQEDMGNILSFANQLATLDVSGVKPTTHAVTIENIFRDDICTESMNREKLLNPASAQDGACYIVPKVID
jgi:aspartyl/glutamyl-tRNA(Asn/Gln) amidotransferase, C subunit